MKKNVHPNSKKNLNLFEPGNNKGGRKKGSISLAKILSDMLEKKITKNTGEKITIKEAVVLAHLKKAMSGDIPAIKEVYDRTDGKIISKTEITGKDGEPLKLQNVTAEEIDDRISLLLKE